MEDYKAPKVLIFDTAYEVMTFIKRVREFAGLVMKTEQVQEVITEIFSTMLNSTKQEVFLKFQTLPDFNLMIGADTYTSYQKDVIRQATSTMAGEFLSKTHSLGVWEENTFSYVFDRFVGNDVLLYYLPY